MAEIKISALTNVTSLVGADTFPVVQSGTTKEADINDVLNLVPVCVTVALSDESTPITAGTTKMSFRMPFGMVLTDVRTSLVGAGSTSGLTTIDINETGTTILSTKLSIDFGELTSTTAATPAVISDSALADDALIEIDIDAVTGGADEVGLKLHMIGTRTAV